MLPFLRRAIPALTLGIGCLSFSGPNLAEEEQLPPDHGYMLIRLKLDSDERVGLLRMHDVDTDHVVTIRQESFKKAGLNAWIALVAMPNGRYFYSEYLPTYGRRVSEVKTFPRSGPGSASDTFEVVSGVVNYVGDWRMRSEMQFDSSLRRYSSFRRLLNPIVELSNSTLERYATQYPEYASKYEIYLAEMGKDAIPFDELVKTAE